MDRAIALVRPGATTADIVKVWPTAQEFGFPDEEAAFALQYGHGVGLSIWEKPIFSRLVSLDHPEVLEEGMFFALETYWPSADGIGAARIEEEIVVTATGCEVVTKFPAEELLVAGQRYYSVSGQLPVVRSSQSHLNTAAGRGEEVGERPDAGRGLLRARDVRVEDRPAPLPGPGEVLLRVLRSGVCGTDATEWSSGPKTFPITARHPVTAHSGPMILGHEFVGTVVEPADGGRFAAGTLVASGAGVSCGTCRRCRQGRTNLCERLLHARPEHRGRDGRTGRRPGNRAASVSRHRCRSTAPGWRNRWRWVCTPRVDPGCARGTVSC